MKISDHHLLLPASELEKASKIHLSLLKNSEDLLQYMARSIADEIGANNRAGSPTRLILPVGPVGQYPILVRICNAERISWKNVFTFNMDEYCDWQGRVVPLQHPLSFRAYMKRAVFDRLDDDLRIPADHIHFPDPSALDSISERIQQAGGIDVCYGGIGYHGHIAFNEPPLFSWTKPTADEYRQSLTRIVPLNPDTVVMNSTWNTGGNPAKIPPMAVTLGMKDIQESRCIRLFCSGGGWQRTVLRMALFGEEDVDYPVTLLRNHPDYSIYADIDTAQPPVQSID